MLLWMKNNFEVGDHKLSLLFHYVKPPLFLKIGDRGQGIGDREEIFTQQCRDAKFEAARCGEKSVDAGGGFP
ncbi:hypothetical protein PCC6912_24550 [Chlorogloeopsis fritschii PCC 6912]|uniref:Uncharacterized protein n=1 Tax=Chlorogloeopsis fritschii PCC 6912 TaxID=211165 RepID=A0A3S1A115_CHLFR|nr:hypothetical protein PCC6912_24550 [Chlorogloeopsis fritschii PCC 6912]